jgi:hypothetical protein
MVDTICYNPHGVVFVQFLSYSSTYLAKLDKEKAVLTVVDRALAKGSVGSEGPLVFPNGKDNGLILRLLTFGFWV